MADSPPGNAVVGAITGVLDRVGDNISGIAQGGVTAVQDLVAADSQQRQAKGFADRLDDGAGSCPERSKRCLGGHDGGSADGPFGEDRRRDNRSHSEVRWQEIGHDCQARRVAYCCGDGRST